MSDTRDIHSAVQEHYGALATSGGTCCNSSRLYEPQLLDDLPVDVTALSLGCGDPVTIASLKPGEIVLDLGSGGGIDCFLAARQVGETGKVIGVDMTPAMLERANSNKARLDLENVEFRQGQIEALPVDDASIDVVMSNCVINLSPDKKAVFDDIVRVLKPGGRVSISDIVTEGTFSAEMRANLAQWSECVSGAIDADVYIALMHDAGFVDVAIVDKVETTENTVVQQHGMPRVFSARITARKPA